MEFAGANSQYAMEFQQEFLACYGKMLAFFLTCYGKPFYGFPNILGKISDFSVGS